MGPDNAQCAASPGEACLSAPFDSLSNVPTANPKPDAASAVVRIWHPFESDSGDQVVLAELSDAIKSYQAGGQPPTQGEIVVRLGELRSLIKAAQRGELTEGSWDAVIRNPLLWEIRWTWDDGGALVRGYFHEPAVPSHQTVLAKVHVKEIVPGDQVATNRRQNAEIDVAGHRVTFGRAHGWALGSSTPVLG